MLLKFWPLPSCRRWTLQTAWPLPGAKQGNTDRNAGTTRKDFSATFRTDCHAL